MITYRKATIEDIDELIKLRITFMKEIMNIDHDNNDQLLGDALKDYFNKILNDGKFISWLAIEDDKIVGTSGLSFYTLPPSYKNVTGDVAYIMNMYTVPSYRSRGIASSLFEKIVLEAKSRGYKKICLHATDMGKPLYTKFGFKEVSGEMELNID